MAQSLGDLQRPGTERGDGAAGQLPLNVTRTRTFDTPEFAGMTFLEVDVKSVLNRVHGMPFAWSINPYRGCSHACSYCAVGETPILMTDGRTKPLADVRVGDEIYGTVRRGAYRRYVTTRVLDHWSIRKAAYRVTLADGTELITSGDHRFLTDRGWKHVVGGTVPKPQLWTGAQLLGIEGPTEHRSAQNRGGTTTLAPAATLVGQRVTTAPGLVLAAVEPLGVELPMYDITTGTGDFIANGVVSHNCFARPSHAYLNLSPVGDFERRIVVKTNLVEVLRRELAKPSWRGESVAMGTNTDPYQRCEGRYRLMPGVIGALADYATPFSILTKGTLITRDIDALVAAAERVEVTAAFTVGMLDESLWRAAEPGTPSPQARLEAVAALNAAGIPTGVMLAPIMPGLNDDRDQLAALVDACAAAGATHITPIVLHLRNGRAPAAPKWMSVREAFWPWLEAAHPELVDRYEQLYARGAYAAKDYRDEVTAFVAEQRKRAWRRHGRPRPGRLRGQGAKTRPKAGNPDADEGVQLSLL